LQSRGWRTDNWINEVQKVVFGLLIFLFIFLFELFILLSMTSILIPRCRIIFYVASKTSSTYNVKFKTFLFLLPLILSCRTKIWLWIIE
jgi:hypothetical protein